MSADGQPGSDRLERMSRSFTANLGRLGRLLLENRSAMAAIALKLGGAFFSFLVIFLVARASGASVTGDYAMAVATASMASLIATLGLDQIATRLIGGDLREGRTDLAWAALMKATRTILPLAAGIALILLLASRFAPLIGASAATMAMIALSVPAFPMLRLAVVTLRAAGSILFSQFFDSAHNVVILAVVSLLIFQGYNISSFMLAFFYSASILVVTLWAWLVLLARTRHWKKERSASVELGRHNWTIFFASVSHNVTHWMVMAQLGAVMGAAEVGAYRVANQIVMIIALTVLTIESMVSPQLAGDFRVHDIAGAWRRHRRATWLMLIVAMPALLACFVVPELVLGGIFGREFLVAAGALTVMAIGQTVNILTGPIGSMMVMSGHEKLSLHLALSTLVFVAVSSAFLISQFGLVGAALSLTSATIFRNCCAFLLMRKYLRS